MWAIIMENFCYSKQMSLDQVAMLVCNTMLALSYMIISDDISDHRDEQHEEIRHQFFIAMEIPFPHQWIYPHKSIR